MLAFTPGFLSPSEDEEICTAFTPISTDRFERVNQCTPTPPCGEKFHTEVPPGVPCGTSTSGGNLWVVYMTPPAPWNQGMIRLECVAKFQRKITGVMLAPVKVPPPTGSTQSTLLPPGSMQVRFSMCGAGV